MWIIIPSILATFDIRKAIDADGNVIEPSGEYTSRLKYQVSEIKRTRDRSAVVHLHINEVRQSHLNAKSHRDRRKPKIGEGHR